MKKFKLFTIHSIPIFYILSLFSILVLITSSCKKIDFNKRKTDESSFIDDKCGTNSNNNNAVIVPCGTPLVSNFIAGQNTDIGSVTIYNTDDSLFIDIEVDGNWWLQTASAYAGSLTGMPQTPSGNPKVGQFPLKKTLNPNTKTVRLTRPLAGLPSCFIVAVHADVRKVVNGNTVQTETAWVQGQNLPGSSWSMAASYCKQSCVTCVYTTSATTLRAEVKQLCAQVLITNDADSLRITYNMFSGWKLKKAQIYMGNVSSMPFSATGDPLYNQFQIIRNFNNGYEGSVTFSYALANLPSNYVIACRAETERTIAGGILNETAWGFGDPFLNSSDWGWTIPYSTQICQ